MAPTRSHAPHHPSNNSARCSLPGCRAANPCMLASYFRTWGTTSAPHALHAIGQHPARGANAADPCVDVGLVVVLDTPAPAPPAAPWLAAAQARMLRRLRLRRHAANLGAAAARNSALRESHAEYVVSVARGLGPAPGVGAGWARP